MNFIYLNFRLKKTKLDMDTPIQYSHFKFIIIIASSSWEILMVKL